MRAYQGAIISAVELIDPLKTSSEQLLLSDQEIRICQIGSDFTETSP